jgi:hypothetical protein
VNIAPDVPFYVGSVFCLGAWLCGFGLWKSRGVNQEADRE